MGLRKPFKLAACLAACSVLGGCGLIKGPWYDPFLLLTPKTQYTGNNRLVSAGQTPNPQPPIARMTAVKPLRVQMLRLNLPVGTFSGNERVWRQLNQDALDSDTSIMLAENGIRAAVAPQDRWPGIHKLIDVPGASSELFTLQTDGRSTIEVITHPNVTEQTISSIDRERQMHVRSFDRCDNSIRLSLNRRRDSNVLTIQLEPVVQLGTISVTRGAAEMGIVGRTARRDETFANLRLAASLDTSEFLVLAPANPRENKFSVGTRFLTDTDQVPPTETILIFLPVKEPQAAARGDDRIPVAVAANNR